MQSSITKTTTESWQISKDPKALTDIFFTEKHIAVWQRQADQTISRYFDAVFAELGQGIRSVYSISSLKQALNDELPGGTNKQAAISDIHLLCDMLTCLFDCQDIGFRLVPMSTAMCPRFHIDNIPVRMVCTYLGNGSQWLPSEVVVHTKLGHKSNGLSDDKSGLYGDENAIQQLNPFDVGLLKGSAWDNDVAKAVVHRSCPIEAGQKRVLLTLDPM